MTNLTLAVAVGSTLGTAALGQFTIGTTVLLIFIGFARAALLEPFLVSPRPVEESAYIKPVMLGFCLSWALISAAAVLAFFADGWIGFAPIGSLLLWQDAKRFIALKSQKVVRCIISDFSILFCVGLGFLITRLSKLSEVGIILGGWAAGIYLGILVTGGIWGHQSVRTQSVSDWWARSHRSLALPLVLDSAIYVFVANGLLFALAWSASSVIVGEVRIVTTFFSPVALIFTGLSVWLLSEFANKSIQEARDLAVRLTKLLLLLALLMGPFAWFLGPVIIEIAFSESSFPRANLLLGLMLSALTAVLSPWLAFAKRSNHYKPVTATRLVTGGIGLALFITFPHLATVPNFFLFSIIPTLFLIAVATWVGRTKTESIHRM